MGELVPIGKLFNLEKGELQSTKCTPGKYDFITAAEDWKTHNSYAHECEALIIAVAASGSLGRTHYVDGKFISSDLCFILTPKNEDKYPLNLAFYHFVFNSLRPILVAATKSGTSKESINQTNLKKYELPYFDIDQQDLWIDKLKKTLVRKELLGSELTHQQILLKKLRQQILQEAIEGKLTADWRVKNPDVEPASELLARIQAEKQQLIKDKKIKKQKPLPAISEEEKPFALPEGWEWCRFQDITTLITCGIASTPAYYPSGRIFLSAKNIKPYRFMPEGHKFVNEETYLKIVKNAKPQLNDILLTRVGAGIGEAAIIDKEIDFAFYVSLTLIKFQHHFIDSKFILNFLNSAAGIKNAISFTTGKGSSQGNLNVNSVRPFLIPLPPLLEQKAIVAKVEKLLALCDQLETQITHNQNHAEGLMQAVLKEAFTQTTEQTKPVAANA